MTTPADTYLGTERSAKKRNKDLRKRIANFLDSRLFEVNLASLMDEIHAEDGPKAALESYIKLLEFVLPKLARTELTGRDGDDLTITLQGILEDVAANEKPLVNAANRITTH